MYLIAGVLLSETLSGPYYLSLTSSASRKRILPL